MWQVDHVTDDRRVESISSGQIRIDGKVVNHVPARDRDIAMVFQSYALYPHMTVFENMAFGLRRRGIPKAEIARKIESVAEGLELSALLRRRPHALSGGQRQRVALGRAIVRKPKVFCSMNRCPIWTRLCVPPHATNW